MIDLQTRRIRRSERARLLSDGLLLRENCELCIELLLLQELLGRKITLKVLVDPASVKVNDYTPSIASIAVLPSTT